MEIISFESAVDIQSGMHVGESLNLVSGDVWIGTHPAYGKILLCVNVAGSAFIAFIAH